MCYTADWADETDSIKHIGIGYILFQYSIFAIPSTLYTTGLIYNDLYDYLDCTYVKSFN